jgi:nitrogen-specific signal transduction histidine kinase
MAMNTESEDIVESRAQVENLRSGIREVAHEINNPLGVVRMAAYFLESTNPDQEKKAHYLKVINDSLDKIEASLKRLRLLRENPSTSIEGISQEGNS